MLPLSLPTGPMVHQHLPPGEQRWPGRCQRTHCWQVRQRPPASSPGLLSRPSAPTWPRFDRLEVSAEPEPLASLNLWLSPQHLFGPQRLAWPGCPLVLGRWMELDAAGSQKDQCWFFTLSRPFAVAVPPAPRGCGPTAAPPSSAAAGSRRGRSGRCGAGSRGRSRSRSGG